MKLPDLRLKIKDSSPRQTRGLLFLNVFAILRTEN